MKVFLCLLLSFVLIISCNEKVIETTSVTLKFTEPMVADSWIEIDGNVFYHFANDTTSEKSKEAATQELHVSPSLISEYPDYVFIPASKIYKWSDYSNDWLVTEIVNAEMAANYVSSINEWQVKLTQSFDILDRIYVFPNNQFELFKGEVTFKRADNQPMRIKTSPNYKATIFVNDKE
ncbi:hypothetical protein ACFCT7_16585 [Fulvivirgaceae bacterium LMO-SS25]